MAKALNSDCSLINYDTLKMLAEKYVHNVKYTMGQSNIASIINYNRNLNSENDVESILKRYDNEKNDEEFDLDAWLNSNK